MAIVAITIEIQVIIKTEASQKISVLLPTFNCQAMVKSTLDSIKWADEIIIIDSFSSDDSVTIASEYGAKVFQHEYINSAI